MTTSNVERMRERKFYTRFGVRVRELRTYHGIRQDQLAKKVGLTRTSIVNIEAGRQRLLAHAIPKFAKALFLSEREFMDKVWL